MGIPMSCCRLQSSTGRRRRPVNLEASRALEQILCQAIVVGVDRVLAGLVVVARFDSGEPSVITALAYLLDEQLLYGPFAGSRRQIAAGHFGAVNHSLEDTRQAMGGDAGAAFGALVGDDPIALDQAGVIDQQGRDDGLARKRVGGVLADQQLGAACAGNVLALVIVTEPDLV